MEIDQASQYFFKSPNTNPMLSPEQWTCCFDNLTREDFLSVINTCAEWNDLPHSQKTTTLLSLVLPVVIDYFPKATILAFLGVNTVAKAVVNRILASRTYLYSPKSSKDMFEYKYEKSLQRRKFNNELSAINLKYEFEKKGSSHRFLTCVDPYYQLSSAYYPFPTRRISIWVTWENDDISAGFSKCF